ncbi:MAG: hypothetical protein FJX75_05125 [Armatimonadetes bacterium]|nr:hypothetical protein [Armatimonadota bacterium]
MGEVRLYEVRSGGGAATVLLSLEELVEAAEQGRVTVALPADAPGEPEGTIEASAGREAPSAAEAPRPLDSLWVRIRNMVERVPAEAWEGVPTDLSEQHDHYIYGTPKR